MAHGSWLMVHGSWLKTHQETKQIGWAFGFLNMNHEP
jgi:hypothetical protein